MEQEKYINKFVKTYPILKGFTDDLLFFVAIDTLFYTAVKGLSAQQIVFLTTIASFFSIISRIALIKVIQKIGNTNSTRLGMGLLLLSAVLKTFGPSYLWIMAGSIVYELAWVFKDMENVMLKNNLKVIGKQDEYAKITNKAMKVYAFLTLIVAISSGFLFNLNPYLPMYLCIIICIIAFIMYFKMKDISNNNIIIKENKKLKKVKLSKLIWIILISYAVYYGIIVTGQQNTKLLIQYSLSGVIETTKVSMYLGFIVTLSRLSRLIGDSIFGKVYYKIKDKSLSILTTLLFLAFVFIVTGYFIEFILFKFLLMTLGFCIILAVRDPFRLYTNDIILKLAKEDEQQVAFSYIQFARKVGTTMCGLIISALLIKLQLIYVIIGIGTLAFIEIIIATKLYSMLNINKNEEIK